MKFTDRTGELEVLQKALNREKCSFVVIYGRRRLGKSTLIKKVLTDGDVYFMADQTEAVNQRRLLASTIAVRYDGFADAEYPSWESLLRTFSLRCEEGSKLCLDEFPYLVKSDESLPSVLQKLLDGRELRYNVIICGSSQQMMYDIALNEGAPLYGRADEVFRLSPIPVRYMTEALGFDAEQAVTEYAVWGGVPRYWELREERQDLKDAVIHYCISPYAMLYDEVSHILRDDMRDTVQASTLLSVIGNGANKMSEIAARVGKDAGSLTGPMGKLQKLQLVEREVPFGENPRNSKRSLYHLSDPYMQFYFRFIAPYRSFIELGRTEMVLDIIGKQMPAFVGSMWDRLCRQAVSGQTLDGITYGMASRWWGGVSKTDSVEIDVMAESLDHRTLLVGECKWTSAEDAAHLEENLRFRASKLPFVGAYDSVRYVLFLKEKPISTANCLTLFPEDVIQLC